MGVKIRKRGRQVVRVRELSWAQKGKMCREPRVGGTGSAPLGGETRTGRPERFRSRRAHMPTFDAYADQWTREYARVECKPSTAHGYEGVLRQYLRPKLGKKRLDEIKRDDVKALINDLIAKDLSRNTIRNALCVLRAMFNQAIEGSRRNRIPHLAWAASPRRPRPPRLRASP